MNSFFNFVGIAAAGALGYYAEPNLRFQLTGLKPSTREIAFGRTAYIQPTDGGPTVALNSLTPEQLPETVLLMSPVECSDPTTGASQTLPAGSRARLISTEGANLVVQPINSLLTGRIPLNESDLLIQLGKKSSLTAIMPRSLAPASAAMPAPAPTASLAPAPPAHLAPAPIVAAPPITTPPPAPAEEASPPPTPEALSPAPATAVQAVSGDVLKIMKASIQAADIQEFKFADVLEWAVDEEEILDGVTYQVGTASYKAETLFGVKTLHAKALIQEGKVVRWVAKKSGLEIK
jgi:hypothetical protein